MKIDPYMTIGKVLDNNVATKRPGNANAFEDMLKSLESGTANKVSPGNMVGIHQGLNPQKIKHISIAEQALDLLQQYADMLSDPDITLREISPVIDDMNKMKASLKQVKDSLSSDDALKGIAQDILTTIDSEVIKYTRGDLTV